MPYFSIIVPVYNVAPYLREALDSIVAQTFTNWECICVDDGSTDGSGEILDEYATKNSRFKVCHKKNGGVSHARNFGLELATGDYIGFVDADDVISRFWLQAVRDVIERTRADMIKVGFRRDIVNDEYMPTICPKTYTGVDLYEWSCLRGGLTVQNFYRREVLEGVRFPEGMRVYEDGVFNLHALLHVTTGAQCDFDGYWYRPSETSSFSHGVSEDEYVRLIDELGRWYVCAQPALVSSNANTVAHDHIVQYVNNVTSNWFAGKSLFQCKDGQALRRTLASCRKKYQLSLSSGILLRRICFWLYLQGIAQTPYVAFVRLSRRWRRTHMGGNERVSTPLSLGASTVYAAWWNNEVKRKGCTSGGIASVLAESVVADGGVVAGAAYGQGLSVRHVLVDDYADLKCLRGVKYVHGNIGRDVYDGIAAALKTGRRVLFVGLPCQAAAMRKVFGLDLRLLIVDLVCFGAPPQTLWQKYVTWLEGRKGKRIRNINPRDKKHGWGRKTYWRYEWEDGAIERKLSVFDPYAQAFYSAIAFRSCCYRCPFRGAEHKSDITIGDGWGVEQIPELKPHVKAGISIVVCHTPQGNKVLETLKDDVATLSIPESLLAKDNRPYWFSPAKPSFHEKFMRDLMCDDFGKLVQKYDLKTSRWTYIKGMIRRTAKNVLGRLFV